MWRFCPKILVRGYFYNSDAESSHGLVLVKHFDRDPHTNQLLWFSGAPIDTPRAQSRQPRHSLDYLYYLARQRERQHRGEDVDESKRKTAAVLPLGVELANIYREVFGGGAVADERTLADTNDIVDVEMST